MMTPLTKEQAEAKARALCAHLGVDPDEIKDPYGPVRNWDIVAVYLSTMMEYRDAQLAERIKARADAMDFNQATTLKQAGDIASKVMLLRDLADEIDDGTFIEVQHD